MAARVTGQAPEPLPLLPAEEAWQVRLPHPPSAGGALDPSRAYIPMGADGIVALERETGASAWAAPLHTTLTPLARDGALYVATASAFHALHAATGDERWRAGGITAAADPVATANLIIIPTAPAGLVALRADDGQRVWTQPLDGERITSLAVGDRTIYASLASPSIAAIIIDDGRLLWRSALDGVPSAPAPAADRLFVGTASARLHALDPRSGRREWRFTLGGSVAGAVASGDRVYAVTFDNLLRAFNRGNGHQRWRQALATRPLAPPRIVGDEIVVTGVDPMLSTFQLASGSPAGTYAMPPALVEGGPLVAPGSEATDVHIVLVLRDGRVVGLRRQEPGDETTDDSVAPDWPRGARPETLAN